MMGNRECPYCHKNISISRCSHYFLHGTNYSIRCNHCNQEVKLLKEPISFNYCFIIGFCISYGFMSFFLYFLKLDFIESLLYTLPIIIVFLLITMILTLKRIIFMKK